MSDVHNHKKVQEILKFQDFCTGRDVRISYDDLGITLLPHRCNRHAGDFVSVTENESFGADRATLGGDIVNVIEDKTAVSVSFEDFFTSQPQRKSENHRVEPETPFSVRSLETGS